MNKDIALVEDHDGKPMTTSLVVAQVFGKEHRRVLQTIRELDCSEEFAQHNFVQSTYLNSQNKPMPQIQITRDGFSFLVMGFTGAKAGVWKEKFINAFNQMESKLTTPMSALDILKNQLVVMEEHEAKLEEQDTRLDGHDHDIKALKHKTSTMGCPLEGKIQRWCVSSQ